MAGNWLSRIHIKLLNYLIRQERALYKALPFHPSLDAIDRSYYASCLGKYVSFYPQLDPQERDRIEKLVEKFQKEKCFEFEESYDHDQALTKLITSALAARMLLNVDEDLFSELKSIRFHDSAFIHDLKAEQESVEATAFASMSNSRIEETANQWSFDRRLSLLPGAANAAGGYLDFCNFTGDRDLEYKILKLKRRFSRLKRLDPEKIEPKESDSAVREYLDCVQEFDSMRSQTEESLRGALKSLAGSAEFKALLKEKNLSGPEELVQEFNAGVEAAYQLRDELKQSLEQRSSDSFQPLEHASLINLTYFSIQSSNYSVGRQMDPLSHELAHCIDFKYGLGGKPIEHEPRLPWVEQWRKILGAQEGVPKTTEDWEELRKKREIFAEACEMFFCRPAHQKAHDPAAYEANLLLFGAVPKQFSRPVWKYLRDLHFSRLSRG